LVTGIIGEYPVNLHAIPTPFSGCLTGDDPCQNT